MIKTAVFIVILVGFTVKSYEDNNNFVIEMGQDYYQAKRPFYVYWNVPTMQCKSKGIPFAQLYEKFGIIQNDDDKFLGNEIVILYDPGLFPALFKTGSSDYKYRNGGIPQEGNLSLHLDAFERTLVQSIPNKNFDGMAIIDFESWRPIFRQNYGVLVPYKEISYKLERQDHPWWFEKWIKQEAEKHFEKAGRDFVEKTIQLAKHLRPKCKWGYYGFPYCFNTENKEYCSDETIKENDRLQWLWKRSDALFPSVYSSKSLNAAQLSTLIKERVTEADRVRGKGKEVYPYVWYRHRDGGFFNDREIRAIVDSIQESEANGFVIWGSSNDVNTKTKCEELYKYIYLKFGPIVARHTKWHNNNVVNLSNDESTTSTDDYTDYLSSSATNNYNDIIIETKTQINSDFPIDNKLDLSIEDNNNDIPKQITDSVEVSSESYTTIINHNIHTTNKPISNTDDLISTKNNTVSTYNNLNDSSEEAIIRKMGGITINDVFNYVFGDIRNKTLNKDVSMVSHELKDILDVYCKENTDNFECKKNKHENSVTHTKIQKYTSSSESNDVPLAKLNKVSENLHEGETKIFNLFEKFHEILNYDYAPVLHATKKRHHKIKTTDVTTETATDILFNDETTEMDNYITTDVVNDMTTDRFSDVSSEITTEIPIYNTDNVPLIEDEPLKHRKKMDHHNNKKNSILNGNTISKEKAYLDFDNDEHHKSNLESKLNIKKKAFHNIIEYMHHMNKNDIKNGDDNESIKSRFNHNKNTKHTKEIANTLYDMEIENTPTDYETKTTENIYSTFNEMTTKKNEEEHEQNPIKKTRRKHKSRGKKMSKLISKYYNTYSAALDKLSTTDYDMSTTTELSMLDQTTHSTTYDDDGW